MRHLTPFFTNGLTTPWKSFFDDMDVAFGEGLRSNAPAFTPQCDIEETDKEYLLSFDVPGLNASDVKVEVKDRELRISGERKRELKSETGKVVRFERTYGQFERIFKLPEGVEVAKIDAHHQDGVLKIRLPKGEVLQARQIEVKSLN